MIFYCSPHQLHHVIHTLVILGNPYMGRGGGLLPKSFYLWLFKMRSCGGGKSIYLTFFGSVPKIVTIYENICLNVLASTSKMVWFGCWSYLKRPITGKNIHSIDIGGKCLSGAQILLIQCPNLECFCLCMFPLQLY